MKFLLPRRTLVLGGASSGKSLWAERFVERSGLQKHYIATAEAGDDEMKSKIARHQKRRDARWITHDAPLALGPALSAIPENDVALFDSATMWLSNHLLRENDLDAAQEALLADLDGAAGAIVVVSDEVGQGVVPEYALGRRFRDGLGRLNQALAEASDLAVLVVAGQALALKGTLP